MTRFIIFIAQVATILSLSLMDNQQEEAHAPGGVAVTLILGGGE